MPDPRYKNLTKEDAHRLRTEDLGSLVGYLFSKEMENKKAKDRITEGYPKASNYKKGGKFPDLTGDGKVTRADVLKGRGVFGKGGKVRAKKSRVNEAGNYTKPGMRKRLFNAIKAGSKGGKPGQWSARKAQLLANRYKKSGGGYTN